MAFNILNMAGLNTLTSLGSSETLVGLVNTNTFLEGFEADPETGDPHGSILPFNYGIEEARVYSQPISSAPFSQSICRTADIVLRAARRIVGPRKKRQFPNPLTATKNHLNIVQWQIESFEDEDDHSVHLTQPQSGKQIAFLEEEDGYEITNGHLHSGWYAQQLTLFRQNGRMRTVGYQFGTRSFSGAAQMLNLRPQLPLEMAIEIAERIYASGQYTPEEIGPMILNYDQQTITLNWQDGHLILPDNLDRRKSMILLSSTSSVIAISLTDVPHSEEENMHILLAPSHDRDEVMPLVAGLRSFLWNPIVRITQGLASRQYASTHDDDSRVSLPH